jgi:hypothetical protein
MKHESQLEVRGERSTRDQSVMTANTGRYKSLLERDNSIIARGYEVI